jgi:hypothetical protein
VVSLAFLAGVVSVLVRFWRAQGIERQQLKWLVYVGAVIAISRLSSIVLAHFPLSAYVFVILDAIALAGLSIGIPVAIGIAMLRHRLWDIDIIINRTLVYGTLTGILALVYVGSIFALQSLLRGFTGSDQLAIVGSTLAIAALFMPLRRRIQQVIDRRFYRRKYDAKRIIDAFSSTLRVETDLTQLSEQLVAVVQETMQPAHISLWLRPSEHDGKLEAP